MQRFRAFLMVGGLLAFAAAGFSLPLDRAAPGDADAAPAGEARTAAIASAIPSTMSAAEPTGTPEAAPEPAAAGEAAAETSPAPASGTPAREPALAVITGSASYYADMFEGRTTASGVPFRQAKMWAAHKTLPFGTRLRVTNLANGNEVEVEVVDRGPYAHGRVLDLSKAAARKLDFIRAGHTRVRIEVLSRP